MMENRLFDEYKDKIPSDLLEKLKKCETMEGPQSVLRENNIELSADEMESVSGGFCLMNCPNHNCPAWDDSLRNMTNENFKPGPLNPNSGPLYDLTQLILKKIIGD